MSWLETITSAQFFRFVLVGLTVNLLGYGIYLLITFAGLAPALAVSILFSVGAAFSFLGNRRYTFRVADDGQGTAVRYAITYFIGYILNLALLHIFVDQVGLPHQAVQAAAILVVAGVMFLLSRYYVFSVAASQDEDRT